MAREMDFLFESIKTLNFNNSNNNDNIYNNLLGKERSDSSGSYVLARQYKASNSSGTNNIINMYKSNIYDEELNGNPYINIIKFFNDKGYRSLKLKPADFAYLSDLGIYPINRLWVLRRFDENAIVPANLTDWGTDVTPPSNISTVVGWVKEGTENLFNISFNEGWETRTEYFYETLNSLLKEEFPAFGNLDNIAGSIPGWSTGIVFAFLQAMGLTDYDITNIPWGDPNVLHESVVRKVGEGGKHQWSLNSDLNLTLETSYEQKFIGNIDPGIAMLDIINNLTKMGTSDVKFIINPQIAKGSDLLNSIRNASKSNNATAWLEVIKKFTSAFLDALVKLITDFPEGNKPVQQTEQENTDEEKEGSNPPKPSNLDVANTIKNSIFNVGKTSGTIINSILASTIGKYRWQLRGGIAALTGENTTPWHLTIGNPYQPFISLNNIIVKRVELIFPNEMGFNDIPTKLDVKITIEQGRNMGGQEIRGIFNNGYVRHYYKASGDLKNKVQNESKYKPENIKGFNNSDYEKI